MDIVENALENNRVKAKEENINNLIFVTYDGIDFPFADQEFKVHDPEDEKSLADTVQAALAQIEEKNTRQILLQREFQEKRYANMVLPLKEKMC